MCSLCWCGAFFHSVHCALYPFICPLGSDPCGIQSFSTSGVQGLHTLYVHIILSTFLFILQLHPSMQPPSFSPSIHPFPSLQTLSIPFFRCIISSLARLHLRPSPDERPLWTSFWGQRVGHPIPPWCHSLDVSEEGMSIPPRSLSARLCQGFKKCVLWSLYIYIYKF